VDTSRFFFFSRNRDLLYKSRELGRTCAFFLLHVMRIEALRASIASKIKRSRVDSTISTDAF